TAPTAPTAARAPKTTPCSTVRNIAMGPATTGIAANMPAIRAPHRLPIIVTQAMSSGTSVSLMTSMGNLDPQSAIVPGSAPGSGMSIAILPYRPMGPVTKGVRDESRSNGRQLEAAQGQGPRTVGQAHRQIGRAHV